MFSRSILLRQSRSIIRSRLIQAPPSSPQVQTLSILPRPISRNFSTTKLQHSSSSSSNNPTTTPMAAETDTSAASFAAQEQITPESLSATLSSSLGATHLDIQDMSGGCGQAFTALIVSPAFEGKTLLARQRLVNGVLKEEIRAIHAWSPRCLTPAQWDKEREKMGQ